MAILILGFTRIEMTYQYGSYWLDKVCEYNIEMIKQNKINERIDYDLFLEDYSKFVFMIHKWRKEDRIKDKIALTKLNDYYLNK
jgi:hypothetical protein